MKKLILAVLSLSVLSCASAQNQQIADNIQQKTNKSGYWQQHADYTMDIDVDVKKYQYKVFNQGVEEPLLRMKKQEQTQLLVISLNYSKLNTLVSGCNQLY